MISSKLPPIAAKILCFVLFVSTPVNASNFYAYHTKLQHSATDYLGGYSDLVVVLGKDKQLEFPRKTGYQPLWCTPTFTGQIDDFFPDRDKDYNFYYTYVRLIENSPEKIIVHLRYYKDTQTLKKSIQELDSVIQHGFTGVVHELFTIYPNGTIDRLVKAADKTRSEDWNHPGFGIKQKITLTDHAIDHSKVDWGLPAPLKRDPIDGNPIIKDPKLPRPIAGWRLDEGLRERRDYVYQLFNEVVENDDDDEYETPLHGLMNTFKKGVSGTALAFDGHTTSFSYDIYSEYEYEEDEENEDETQENHLMTLQAWIALDVYPYNDAPIIHESKNIGEQGYYFGIDAYGHLIFIVNGSRVQSENKIPLYKWHHVAGIIDENQIHLYIDGEKIKSAKLDKPYQPLEINTTIGLNTEKLRGTDYVRDFDQNLPFILGFQGLMDELRIYDQVLTAKQIKSFYKTYLPENRTSDLTKAVLPGEVGQATQFGATYKKLVFHELWDNMWRNTNYADIVVKFDQNPCSVVYWRGTNYAANWITDKNNWMADQSSEIFTKHGCSEHMSDKQTRHSYARIIENSPARVIIHWRYPCVDIAYICPDRLHWTDEYHTIYPDGTGVRKVIWNRVVDQPGFQDVQLFTNPGQTALDVVDLTAKTVANLDGKIGQLTWKKPNRNPRNPIRDSSIEIINTKSDYKVFLVYSSNGSGTWGRHEQSEYTDDPFAGPWNHWPIYFIPSDGRFAVDTDRVSHFALGGNGDTKSGSRVLYGFTNQSIDKLVPLARSWRKPAKVISVKGATSHGFNADQKSFDFDRESDDISFTIHATNDHPVVNPCIKINNWQSDDFPEVSINNTKIDYGPSLRKGIVRDTQGQKTLLLWVEKQTENDLNIQITN